MNQTKIEWATKTWNPVVGCEKCSPGCKNCYAEKMAKRLKAMGIPHYQNVVDDDGKWTGEIGVASIKTFQEPLKLKKPSRIFVCSMGDLFHPNVPIAELQNVYEIMKHSNQHEFIVCTKRPELMIGRLNEAFAEYFIGTGGCFIDSIGAGIVEGFENVIHLATIENQEQADKRIPELLKFKAAGNGAWRIGVSIEPMLGAITIPNIEQLDWVIVGGETGAKARPMHPDWVRSVRDQCTEAGVPFFFKSWGEWVAPEQMPDKTYRAWDCHHGIGGNIYEPVRVGKKPSGSLIDGVAWEQFPEREL